MFNFPPQKSTTSVCKNPQKLDSPISKPQPIRKSVGPCQDCVQGKENELELWETVQTAWREFSQDRLTHLIDSMPHRCEAVVKARGGLSVHTLYFKKVLFMIPITCGACVCCVYRLSTTKFNKDWSLGGMYSTQHDSSLSYDRVKY